MIVSLLRQEVADLDFLLNVRTDRVLRSRNSMSGSLVRLVRECFALFECGIPSLRNVDQKRQAQPFSTSMIVMFFQSTMGTSLMRHDTIQIIVIVHVVQSNMLVATNFHTVWYGSHANVTSIQFSS